ncbi:GatB/YqeY domain-containing protein [Benzoatithermus flavus]|uniref:GatB/YqeY domain-containing protein n=1 Tax=Benzoatithermus flavus TaxID=3108223 RepID=A0ABU8XVS6_9PROT
MLRERLNAALKEAVAAGEQRAAATLRLILAAIRERDRVAREAGAAEGLDEAGIVAMLQDMVAQRRQEIIRCEACARVDRAEQEAEEIRVIEPFLPPRMSQDEIRAAVEAAIEALGATRLKDTGKVIAALKERYGGRMDFACAKRLLCERLH